MRKLSGTFRRLNWWSRCGTPIAPAGNAAGFLQFQLACHVVPGHQPARKGRHVGDRSRSTWGPCCPRGRICRSWCSRRRSWVVGRRDASVCRWLLQHVRWDMMVPMMSNPDVSMRGIRMFLGGVCKRWSFHGSPLLDCNRSHKV